MIKKKASAQMRSKRRSLQGFCECKSFLKSGVSFTLVVVLMFSFPYVSHSDSVGSSRAMVSLSHKMARELADELFRFYLSSGVIEGIQNNLKLKSMARVLIDLQKKLSKQMGDRSLKVSLSIEEALAVLEDEESSQLEVISHLQKAMDGYRDLLVEMKMNKYILNSSEVSAQKTQKAVERILHHFKKTCDQGVEAQFTIPNLPPLLIRSPEFQVGFNFRVSSDGDYTASEVEITPYGSPSLATLFGNQSSAGSYGAALSTLTYLGAYELAVLSGFAQGSSAAYLMGGIYTLAIMMVIYTVMDHTQKKKAKQQADAVEYSVRKKANSADVAIYYKELCKTYGSSLLQVLDDFKRFGEYPALDEKEIKSVEGIFENMSKLSKKIDIVVRELKAKGFKGVQLQQELEKTQEFRDRTQYIQSSVGLEGFVRAIRTQILLLVSYSDKALNIIKKIKLNSQNHQRTSEVLMRLKTRLQDLYGVAYEQSLEAQDPQALQVLRQEIQKEDMVAKYYLRWQKGYARYLSLALQGEDGKAALVELQSLASDLKQDRMKYSSSKALDIIFQRLFLFLQRVK